MKGKHRKPVSHTAAKAATLLTTAVAFAVLPVTMTPAHATMISPGNAALNWAENPHNALGCWYSWGGTNCAQGFDCSGLVSTAILKATGIWIGRDTYDMFATSGHGHLHWIPLSDARRGDILFFGSGHVEIKTAWYHGSFGALEPGTRVGWHTWSGWWHPTAAYRVW